MSAAQLRQHPEEIFRDILGEDRSSWLPTIEPLRRRLLEAGCHYGEREIVKVLRPKFLSRSEYLYLSYVTSILMGVFRRLAGEVLTTPALQEFMNLSADEMRLIAPEPLCPDPCAFARLDSFQTDRGFQFVELNGEAPAGAGFADQTAGILREHPVISELGRRTPLEWISAREGVLGGLLTAWRIAGKTSLPTILITDYLDLPTLPEFHMIRDYLESQGLVAILEDPRALSYQHGRLIAKGQAIDLVYRRVITSEFLEREEEVRPLFDAYADQAIVMVDPFRAKLIHKKSAFALLSGELLGDDWLSSEERQVISRHVPWTRRAKHGFVMRHGERIDLIPWAVENKDELVLKPADDYGGAGVVIGWLKTTEEFEAELTKALELDYVLQSRVRPQEELFPVLENDLQDQPMVVDLDPYIYFGRVHGVLARLAAGALCNVTSGGGQIPVCIHPDL